MSNHLEILIADSGNAGKAAFTRGAMRVPAHDPAVAALIKRCTEHEVSCLPVLDAWLKAWDRANLAAPIDTISKIVTITVKHASHKGSGAGKLVATGSGRKKTINYPHELSSAEKYIAAAKALCDAQGWTGLTRSTASPFVFTATAEG